MLLLHVKFKKMAVCRTVGEVVVTGDWNKGTGKKEKKIKEEEGEGTFPIQPAAVLWNVSKSYACSGQQALVRSGRSCYIHFLPKLDIVEFSFKFPYVPQKLSMKITKQAQYCPKHKTCQDM